MTRMPSVDSVGWTRGTEMPTSAARFLPSAVPTLASCRNSSSSWRPPMSSSVSAPRPDRPCGLDAALQAAGDHPQDRRVARDDVLDPRPPDLDDDPRAVVQDGPVRLSDRRRGERLPLERRERLLDRLAELGLDGDADVVGPGPGGRPRAAWTALRSGGAGSTSLRVEAICPSLTIIPPDSSSTVRTRCAEVGRVERRSGRVAPVQEVRAPRVGDDLAQPPVGGELPP